MSKARIILDRANDAFVEIDMAGIVIDWNTVAENIFGWKREEILGKTLSETIIPTRYREAHIKGLKHFQHTGEGPVINKTIEIAALHREGHEFPIELSIFPISLAGTVTFGAFLRDISKHKKTEEALIETQERFRLLVSNVRDYAIFMLDPEGTIMTWNEGAQRIKGYSAEEIIGKHVSHFYTNDDKLENKPMKQLKTALESGRYEGEEQRQRKDGSIFWANVIITPIRDQHGGLLGFAKVTRDISERKIAVAAIQEQAALLNLSHDAIIVRDIDGTIRYWNHGSEEMYGYAKNEAIGNVSHQLLQTVFPKSLAEVENDIITTGRWDGELIHTSKSGRHLIVSSRQVLKRDAFSNPSSVLEIGTDITLAKQAEQKQIALNEMKRVNVELEQFAYIASHDLQEPLRAVTGCLQIIEKNYKGKLDDNAHELIDLAVDGAQRMRNLINDLLSLSRVANREITLKQTDLGEILAQALKNLELTIKERQAEITYDDLPTVVAEETQLVQLFQNLIGNSIKYGSEQSPKIHIGCTKDENNWVISVADNGIGFDQEHADKIFEPFKRLHGRDKYPGSGIGLAICKKIVERHNGRIWADSKLGEGSTFYFTLPNNLELS